MDKKEEILKVLSLDMRRVLASGNIDFEALQEIRLRMNQPLLLKYQNHECFVNRNGRLQKNQQDCYIVKKKEIAETLEYISSYSFYAFEEEIRQGFITIQGGHRVGVAGKAVMEQKAIKNLKHISFLNIRLSHQIKGCADKVIPYLENGTSIRHTLVVSPPGAGKTTLLRDIIRQLSNGTKERKGLTVGVVDERSEIGACYLGVPQNDLGIRTDILDCCPKAEGMMMLIRSMSPDIIAVDEIGTMEDVKALEYAINCGCKMIGTVHGDSVEDIISKPCIGQLVTEHLFERFIVLNGRKRAGCIEGIYDNSGNCLYHAL